jgi:hypothetical protein
MPRQITFDLKVSVQNDGSCVFYLIWDGGKRDLFASQLLPAKLRRDYDSWRRQYLRYYKLQPEQPISRSGSFSVRPNGDLSSAVRNAEDALVTTFLDWLGAEDTRAIERQLQTALVEVAQSGDDDAPGTRGVNVFLACEDNFLQKLPWEDWARNLIPRELSSNSIRLIRTARDDPQGLAGRQRQDVLKRPRILAILAKDKHLNMEGDWKILLDLRSVADVEKAKWLPNDPPHVITRKVFETIEDDRGWDILFFAGHSDDQANASGVFKLTPTVDLSINDIREHLETAQQQGLRLAIFNSCSGLAIAQSLVHLGVQAIAMREPVRSDAALAFLERLCQQLREHEDAQEAMSQACQVLRSAEKSKFPSAHLIPSFFSPPRIQPYRIKPYGWRQQIRKWLPTKREIKAAGIVLLLGALPVVNDALIEARVGLQAVYRDLTGQVPKLSEDSLPPVHVVAVDQRALDDEGITEAKPISQGLIADLIEAIEPYQPRTVGIAYLLDNPDEDSSRLINTMRATSQELGTWFGVLESDERNLEVFGQLHNLEVSLRGDSRFLQWDVDIPDDRHTETLCPFGYLMALSHSLNADSALGELSVFREKISQETKAISFDDNDFCNNVIALADSLIPNEHMATDFIRQNRSFFGWQSIIDFSLPEDIIYTRTLASNLLDEDELSQEIEIQPSAQVFIIGSGDYADAEDNYSPPLALEYWWCLSLHQNQRQNCNIRPRRFSSSEAYAYMVSQLLQRHQVRVVPNYLMTGLFIIIGKGMVITLQRQPQARRRKLIRYLFLMIAGYTIISFQLYISATILFPILFPMTILLNYLAPISKRTYQ